MVNPPGINHHPALSDEFDVDMCVCGEEWPCSTVRNLINERIVKAESPR